MKKILKGILESILIIILLAVIIVICFLYMPEDSKQWKEKISSTSPEEYSVMSEERKNILKEFDTFVLNSASESYPNILKISFSKQFKLNWLLQKDTYKEIQEEVKENSLKVWYVYNMGIIAKTDDTVICFDLSTVIPTPQLIDLAKTCNYLFLSHTDGDHLNALAVQEVLKNGGKVIMQDNIGIVGETIKSLTSEEQFENVSILESEKEYTINDIEIYSIQTTHRGSQEQDNTWFSVTVNGFNIVHTGDGTLNDSSEWSKFGDIDLLLANTIIQTIDLRDSDARYIIPLHLHELGHNRSFLEENCFTSYLEKLDSFEDTISSKIYLLLWGESIMISK